MLAYSVEAALNSGAERVVVVTGYGIEQVQAALKRYERLEFALQAEQLGTAHALMQAKSLLADFHGPVVVKFGDGPLNKPETLSGLAERMDGAGMSMLTMLLDDPTGYGRILRDTDGEIVANIEQKDATPEQQAIREINPGVFCFDSSVWEMIEKVDNQNAAKEYYLPDLIKIYRAAGKRVVSILSDDPGELLGVNSRQQLAQVEQVLISRLCTHWMTQGVRIIRSETVYIEPTVELAADVTLWPGVILRGSTKIAEGAEVGAYSVVLDSTIGAGAKVKSHSVLENTYLGAGSDAGPFARLRAGTIVEEDVHIGNFVETKNTHLKRGVKAGHVSYLGDTEVGEDSNIGAGTITANYDGKHKHKTIIGRGVFIGSNSTLIPPITIGDGAFVAGGSGINQNVPEDALAIARARQENKDGFMRRKRESE